MLALAITVLVTLTGIISAAVIADNLIKARAAYGRLICEGEIMRAGFSLQAAAVDMQLRRATRITTARQRAVPSRPLRLQVCVAA